MNLLEESRENGSRFIEGLRSKKFGKIPNQYIEFLLRDVIHMNKTEQDQMSLERYLTAINYSWISYNARLMISDKKGTGKTQKGLEVKHPGIEASERQLRGGFLNNPSLIPKSIIPPYRGRKNG